jgi:N-acetylmuramoyl-L-alanine amidase
MRWTNRSRVLLATAVILSFVLAISGAPPDQQLTVYTAQTTYSLPVLDHGGQPCIALMDLLTPLGVSEPRVSGKDWKLKWNTAEARFTDGKNKASIRGNQVDLGGNALVENKRLLVPLAAALPILTRLLNTTVDFHQPSRRIFVGNTFTHFTAELRTGDHPALVLNFSQPVTPDVRHEKDGNLPLSHADRTTLVFRHEPVVTEATKQQFGEGPVQSLSFIEENGAASLILAGNAELDITRSSDGKSITLQPTAPAASASPTPQQSSPATAETQRHAPPEFFVMIDPSHGGEDRGASFGGRLVEKDITLALAKELRRELEERGIAARLLRDSDTDVSLERRAEITNEQHASIYIALHAGRPGKGVRVYAPLLPNPEPADGRFLLWESAQQAALDRSNAAALAVTKELRKRGLTVASLGMPLRPLNNIAGPAIAVELAPDSENVRSLENLKLQNTVASAIASGIVQMRGQIGGRP